MLRERKVRRLAKFEPARCHMLNDGWLTLPAWRFRRLFLHIWPHDDSFQALVYNLPKRLDVVALLLPFPQNIHEFIFG